MKQRVIVGMSGGVDSTLAAALLQEAGYDVVGVTLKLYSYEETIEDTPEAKRECHPTSFIQHAKDAASLLNIEHHVIHEEELFKAEIIQPFVDAYQKGRTPLPCAKCNRDVKTAALWRAMEALDGNYIATGHYVQRVEAAHGAELHRGVDLRRDQSFFLFMLTYQHIQRHLFPLGAFSKDETRLQAAQRGLKNAQLKASQDLCFMAKTSYQSWIHTQDVALKAGRILHEDGRVLGEHQGLEYFTIGQRQGLGIGGFEDPVYVTGMNLDTHDLIVGPRTSLGRNVIFLEDINWVAPDKVGKQIPLWARIRSSSSLIPATFFPDQKRIVLEVPEYGVAPGQACVFYDQHRLLGGGWISKSALEASC